MTDPCLPLTLNFSKAESQEPLKEKIVIDQEAANPVDELAQEIETLDVKVEEPPASISPVSSTEHVKFSDEDQVDTISNRSGYYEQERSIFHDPESQSDYFRAKRSSSPFQYSKRQTGKKNISSIMVGNDKIEYNPRYNQIVDDRGFSKSSYPIGVPTSTSYGYEQPEDHDSMHSRDSEQNRTADGFFDLKFYSHPLW